MPNKIDAQNNIAACLFSIGNGKSDSIQIFPAGTFTAPDGALAGNGPWVLNKDQAEKLIAAVSDQQNILIDYDHQSLLFTKNQRPLAAAGTFSGSGLKWVEGEGLFATGVQWTAAAADKIKSGAYKYISPLFTYDNKTGAVKRLISIAVTDNPAIKNMQEIELAAASFFNHHHHEDTMKKQLLALLGLDENADDAAIIAACSELKSANDEKESLAKELDKLTAENEKLAATSEDHDESKFVPVDVVIELQEKFAALSKKVESDKVAKLIADNASKLPTASLREWAAEQDFAALSAYLEKAPEIAALNNMQTEGKEMDSLESAESLVAAANKYQAEMKNSGTPVDDLAAIKHVKGAK